MILSSVHTRVTGACRCCLTCFVGSARIKESDGRSVRATNRRYYSCCYFTLSPPTLPAMWMSFPSCGGKCLQTFVKGRRRCFLVIVSFANSLFLTVDLFISRPMAIGACLALSLLVLSLTFLAVFYARPLFIVPNIVYKVSHPYH